MKKLIAVFIILGMLPGLNVFAHENGIGSNLDFCSDMPAEVLIKADIYEEIKNGSGYIDTEKYGLTKAELESLATETAAEKGLSNIADMECVEKDGIAAGISLKYNDSDIELFESSEMQDEIDNILSGVDDSMNDVEKALAVHDYFELHYCYDYSYSNYTKEELFIEKTGVCAAYARGYQYILTNYLRIPCLYIISEDMNHAWNLIKIDDNWYHVDCTWDDSINGCRHLHFMVSDEAMADSERKHYNWESPNKATDTSYDNYFWKKVNSAILKVGGYYYYAAQDEYVHKRNPETGEDTGIYKIDSRWPCYEKAGYFWRGCFAQIAYYDGRIYVSNKSNIVSMDVNGANVRELVSQDPSEGYIYGMVLNGNTLTYDISRDYFVFGIESSKNTVLERSPEFTMPGDVNGDGKVAKKDLLRLAKHFSGYDVAMDMKAADVTGDGKVTQKDLLRLARYFSGYNVVLVQSNG